MLSSVFVYLLVDMYYNVYIYRIAALRLNHSVSGYFKVGLAKKRKKCPSGEITVLAPVGAIL